MGQKKRNAHKHTHTHARTHTHPTRRCSALVRTPRTSYPCKSVGAAYICTQPKAPIRHITILIFLKDGKNNPHRAVDHQPARQGACHTSSTRTLDLGVPIAEGDDSSSMRCVGTCAGIAPSNRLQGWSNWPPFLRSLIYTKWLSVLAHPHQHLTEQYVRHTGVHQPHAYEYPHWRRHLEPVAACTCPLDLCTRHASIKSCHPDT